VKTAFTQKSDDCIYINLILLIVTCGLTACTPGSAPGPMLNNEYG